MAGAKNKVDNAGLFEHVQVDDRLLNDTDRRVMNTGKGPVNAKAFVELVRKMVADRWIEQGGMRSEPR
jgi:predicted Zn-dependent peptidase